MDPIKVDESGSLRIGALVPGAYYQPEIVTPEEIKLRRIQAPAKMSRTAVLKAIEKSSLRFTKNWAELKKETRV